MIDERLWPHKTYDALTEDVVINNLREDAVIVAARNVFVKCARNVVLYGAEVDGDVNLYNAKVIGDVVPTFAKVSGDIVLDFAKAGGEVRLDNAKVRGVLHCGDHLRCRI